MNFSAFFAEKIENDKKVTSLLITTNWEDEASQEDQQVFCHLKYLKKACDHPGNIYVEDK